MIRWILLPLIVGLALATAAPAAVHSIITRVIPPWWQMMWFRVAAVMLTGVVLVLLLAYFQKTYGIRQQNRKLEEINQSLQREILARQKVEEELRASEAGDRSDITLRKLAEIQLKASEERFRMVWEAAGDAMVLVNLQGFVLAANPAYFDLFRVTRDDVIDKHFTDFIPTQNLEMVEKDFQTVLSDEARLHFERTIFFSRWDFHLHRHTHQFHYPGRPAANVTRHRA